LGVASSNFSELCGALKAIEIAYQKGWHNLWLEIGSSLVVSSFKNPAKPVVWSLRTRWNNALLMLSHMNCIVTHIYREGNQVADLLANHGLSLDAFNCWLVSALFLHDNLFRNKLDLSSFRLCSS
jgi:ribonuclease HI